MNTLHMDISKMLEKKITRSFQSCVEMLMLSNWFDFCPVGCVFDKFLQLWIAFQKDFALLLELNSKNMNFFWYQRTLFLESNQVVVIDKILIINSNILIYSLSID